ncbi:putative glycosyltransferase [Apostasia shenzhenica]|uniref:Putative glycosyltransferase n=1 Tax=Apostasia shenzhenica TaxID=1088818 RepID=A0A2I0ASK5_9ASPA|nr:putative glycosyltransferase [Apostasia shenzhenica]
MADRHFHSAGQGYRKPIFLLFSIATLAFGFSWFFLLGSTGSNITLTSESQGGISGSEGDSQALPQLGDAFQDSSGPQDHESDKCDPNNANLKVFMYDLPPEFHFGLLDWKPENNSVWPDILRKIPDYPGGLNLQHSIEYWLTLDVLSSTIPDRPGPCFAVRVRNSHDADVVFVPFFSSLSYNRHSKVRPPAKTSLNTQLQSKLVRFLTAQEEWKRSGGRDHVILAHHPNSMLDVRMKLWPCMFVLSDFGRYPPNVANVEKDVIAPYKHVIKTFVNDSAGYDDRPTLLYFKGAIYRKDGGIVRQELFYLLKDEKDVEFSFGTVQKDGIRQASAGMHSSKFCLNIAGDTPSSNRLFDAIASHCVPVIISDEIELPFEDFLDYSKFCVFVKASDAVKKGFLMKLIRGITKEEWTQMWEKLKEIEGYFEFHYPSQKDDAVQMIWQAIARKVPAMRLKLHRSWRFHRFQFR